MSALRMAVFAATAVLLSSPGQVRNAWAQSDEQAVNLVKSATEQLVTIADSPGSPREKNRRLEQLVDSAVDVEGNARVCLGRFWRTTTPEQQRQYTYLSRDFLVMKIGDQLGEYKGVRLTVGRARTSADNEIVITVVERPHGPSERVDWVVGSATGTPKIVDLLVQGTSLLLTQCNDISSYLASHQFNVSELIDAMRLRVAQNSP